MLAFAGALVLIGVAPVVALGPIELVAAFRGWVGMTRGDYGAVATGAVVPWSVGSMLRFGCALPLSSQNLELAGAVIAFSPLALSALPGSRARLHGSFGRMLVGSLLTYVVLFNHRSEYCSFVIGAIGVALWATAARHDLDANFVALFALAFIALGPFPTSAPVAPFSLELFVVPRAFHPLRMLGLFVLWILMQRDLWRAVFSREPHARLSQP